MYPDSHIVLHNRSALCRHDWRPVLFSLFFFFFCKQCSSQCWNPKLLTFEYQENCRVGKKKIKAEHIRCYEPKLPTWNVWQSVSSDTQTHYVHVWWLLSPLIFFVSFCVFLRWSLGLWTNNRTRHPSNIQKYYILNLRRERQFCNYLHAVTGKKKTTNRLPQTNKEKTDAFQTGFSQKYTKIYI